MLLANSLERPRSLIIANSLSEVLSPSSCQATKLLEPNRPIIGMIITFPTDSVQTEGGPPPAASSHAARIGVVLSALPRTCGHAFVVILEQVLDLMCAETRYFLFLDTTSASVQVSGREKYTCDGPWIN